MTAKPLDLWSSLADQDRAVGRVSDAWKAQIDKDINLGQALMVVELVFGDTKRFRVATNVLEVVDQTGADRWVIGALQAEAEVVNDYDIDNASSGARGVTFQVPSWLIRPMDRQRNGFPLSGFGEVSLLADGMEWNSRKVILRGDMSGGVSYGPLRENVVTKQGQPATCDAGIVALKLQDPRESADASFPPYIVDVDRWPDTPINGIGAAYPTVWGQGITVCPAVDTDRFLVAIGHDWDVLTVYRDDEAVAGFTADKVHDELGVAVTIVRGLSGGAVSSNETVKAQFQSTIDDSPDLLVVIRDALDRYGSQGTNLASPTLFADAQAKLGPTTVQAQANAQAKLFQWIEGDLLDDFPMISMVWKGGRYGPVVTDFRAPPRTHLVCGTPRLPFRIGDPNESPKDQTFNSFTMRYGYDLRLDTFGKILRRDPSNSRLCKVSEGAVGPGRIHPLIESFTIVEDTVAGYVLDWMEHHLTLQNSFVEYGGPGSLFFELARGDTVLLTDADLLWFGVRATVERIVYQRGFTQLGLRMWQNPFRTSRFPLAP